jgi:hypothetical protein
MHIDSAALSHPQNPVKGLLQPLPLHPSKELVKKTAGQRYPEPYAKNKVNRDGSTQTQYQWANPATYTGNLAKNYA